AEDRDLSRLASFGSVEGFAPTKDARFAIEGIEEERGLTVSDRIRSDFNQADHDQSIGAIGSSCTNLYRQQKIAWGCYPSYISIMTELSEAGRVRCP
ncbi:MAG: hypothetical protein WBF73_32140, partial [Bradyrhizobium sp.]